MIKFGVHGAPIVLQQILGRMEQTVTVAGMAVVGRKAVYGTGEARNRVGYAVGAEGRGAVVRGRTLSAPGPLNECE